MARLPSFIQWHEQARQNRWYHLFALGCRLLLAAGFLTSGMVKIYGERFASGLSALHPMGAYLTALHHTGFYYTLIGVAQVLAAVLLLVPRTALLGAMLYFPIILNIWLLSVSVRFEGSLVSSTLMVLANSFLLVWYSHRLRPLFAPMATLTNFASWKRLKSSFPWAFAAFVIVCFAGLIVWAQCGFELVPRNSMRDCQAQFKGRADSLAGRAFCECIHQQGRPLGDCIKVYEKMKNKPVTGK